MYCYKEEYWCTQQFYVSSDSVHTIVMAKKEINRKLTQEYAEHWEIRMKLMEKQIRELVEEGFCDEDIPLKMSDKRLYFVLRDKWQQLIEIWRPVPSTDFTSTEDKKCTIMKALKRAGMKATTLQKWEEKINNDLRSWAEEMTGWLTLQEKGEWLMDYFQQGKIPIGNWYDEVDFDMY